MQLPRLIASLLTCPLLLALGSAVVAQQAPSAGSQMTQIPAQPVIQTPKPDMRVEHATPPAGAPTDTKKVLVKALRLTGAHSISEQELIGVSGFESGSRLSVTELRALAAKITAHYRSLGYVLAQTYMPSQDITDGVVQLTVVEGQYGQVKLQNRSRLSDGVANTLLAGLKGADAVTAPALERRILMLSDLPGISVKSTVVPGTLVGSTDLIVDIVPGQAISGTVEADNQGNLYTGQNRIGASINFNEPTGLGDVATMRVLTSGEGLAFGRASYQAQLGPVSVGLAYTAMQYTLGGEFASTQSSGNARIESIYFGYPLIRGRNHNLSALWTFDHKEFSDRALAGAPGSNSDKNAQVSTLSLRGDFRDALGNGFGNYLLTWSHGSIGLQNPEVLALDAQSAQSNGMFDKVVYALARQQEITPGTGLYVSAYGQWASKNLDASEKISLGGAGGVRAFPSGEASGDDGLLFTLETRTRLPTLAAYVPGQWQLVGFVDVGSVSLNKTPWDTTTPTNRRSLSGGGLGLNFVSASNWMVKTSWAFKLGDESAKSAPDSAGRFWLQVNKSF